MASVANMAAKKRAATTEARKMKVCRNKRNAVNGLNLFFSLVSAAGNIGKGFLLSDDDIVTVDVWLELSVHLADEA